MLCHSADDQRLDRYAAVAAAPTVELRRLHRPNHRQIAFRLCDHRPTSAVANALHCIVYSLPEPSSPDLGSTLFEQNGTSQDDEWEAAAAGVDGSIILAGVTEGDWVETNTGEGDFAALSLDAAGTAQWSYQASASCLIDPSTDGYACGIRTSHWAHTVESTVRCQVSYSFAAE